MKARLRYFLTLATLCCLTATAQDKKFLYASAATYPFASDFYYTEPDSNFYVFLCFGQSNMQGAARPEDKDYENVPNRLRMMAAVDFPANTGNYRGAARKKYEWYTATPPLHSHYAGLSPADYFGRAMVEHLPSHIKVGLINVSVTGCAIEVFFKEYDPACNARLGSSTRTVCGYYDGLPYVRLLSCALRAAKVGVIKGILLHQGEANRTDPLWCMKVKHVYDDLLHDLGLQARDVPLLAGQVVGEEQHGKSAIANKNVNALPKTIPTAHVISSVGCEADPDDTHHFSAEGYRTFGRRYADVMLDLMGVEH